MKSLALTKYIVESLTLNPLLYLLGFQPSTHYQNTHKTCLFIYFLVSYITFPVFFNIMIKNIIKYSYISKYNFSFLDKHSFYYSVLFFLTVIYFRNLSIVIRFTILHIPLLKHLIYLTSTLLMDMIFKHFCIFTIKQLLQ